MDTLYEKAPPDPKIEDWIQKNKERFKKEYGDEKGIQVLYSTAWKMYDKKVDEDESFDYSEELEEAQEIWDDRFIEESIEILEIWTNALNEAEEASHEEIINESEEEDDEEDDEDDESVEEATSRKERRQKSKKMKRSSKKMARARKKKKPLTKDRVKKRARSRARSEIKKKYGGKSDSESGKKRSEKKLKRMSKKVDRLAKKKEKSVRKDRN